VPGVDGRHLRDHGQHAGNTGHARAFEQHQQKGGDMQQPGIESLEPQAQVERFGHA